MYKYVQILQGASALAGLCIITWLTMISFERAEITKRAGLGCWGYQDPKTDAAKMKLSLY